jgi:hypothetical protein
VRVPLASEEFKGTEPLDVPVMVAGVPAELPPPPPPPQAARKLAESVSKNSRAVQAARTGAVLEKQTGM